MSGPAIIRPKVPDTTTRTDMSVGPNPFALTDMASGDAGAQVFDPQTGQEVLYNPQSGQTTLIPSLFDVSIFNFDAICLDANGASACISYLDPQIISPVPHLTQGTDKLASALTQNDPRDPILPGLTDAYADLYFLREIARGERTLTDDQENYLRQHAAGIAYVRREAVISAFSPQAPSSDQAWELLGFGDPAITNQDPAIGEAVSVDATAIYKVYGMWQQEQLGMMMFDFVGGSADSLGVLEDWYVDSTGTVVDPYARSEKRAQVWADTHADKEVSDYVLKHADRATILRLQLANARIRIRTILETEARDSYLDHTEDIAALAKIDDPAKLASALQELSSRIVRGQKLKQLEKAAMAVGNEVVYGKRKIDLAAQIRKLSKLPLTQQKEFYEGVKKFIADHKIVALDYSLAQVQKIVAQAEKAAGKVEHAPPKLSNAERLATAGPGGGRSGVTMASMRSEGTKERNELESYFGAFGDRISAARAKITKGDLAGARKAFNDIKKDNSFEKMKVRLKEALGFEEGYRMGQKIGIIVVAAAFAAIGGLYVGAALTAKSAPAWVVTLGSLATEAALFLGGERVLSKVMMDEQIFDPKKGVKGNAVHYAGEWVKTMLMFGFLRAGAKAYKGVVDAVVGSRAAKSIVEGVIAKAEKVLKRMNLNPALAGKLARSAKLSAFGKILNHGGAFGAEYATFTAWDYLMQLHEIKSLPKNFFTSKSMVDRLIFLGCLKMGGAAARPFVQPIQAKVMAGQMKRYAGRIDKYNTELQSLNKELVEYDAAGTADFAKITSIHGRMKNLLKKRAGLEAAILKINPGLAKDHPEFAEGVENTKRAIKGAEAREKKAAVLTIIQSGSYTKGQKKKLMAFLKEGAKRERLSYSINGKGEIRVTYASAQPVTVVVKPASKGARTARGRATVKPGTSTRKSEPGKPVIKLGESISSESAPIGTLHYNGINATIRSSSSVKAMKAGGRRRRVMFYTIRIESRGREFTEAERTAIERKLKPELNEFGIEYGLEFGKSTADNATPKGQVNGVLVRGATASGVVGAPRRSAPAGTRLREMGSLAALSVFAPDLIGRIAEVSPELAAMVMIGGTLLGALGVAVFGGRKMIPFEREVTKVMPRPKKSSANPVLRQPKKQPTVKPAARGRGAEDPYLDAYKEFKRDVDLYCQGKLKTRPQADRVTHVDRRWHADSKGNAQAGWRANVARMHKRMTRFERKQYLAKGKQFLSSTDPHASLPESSYWIRKDPNVKLMRKRVDQKLIKRFEGEVTKYEQKVKQGKWASMPEPHALVARQKAVRRIISTRLDRIEAPLLPVTPMGKSPQAVSSKPPLATAKLASGKTLEVVHNHDSVAPQQLIYIRSGKSKTYVGGIIYHTHGKVLAVDVWYAGSKVKFEQLRPMVEELAVKDVPKPKDGAIVLKMHFIRAKPTVPRGSVNGKAANAASGTIVTLAGRAPRRHLDLQPIVERYIFMAATGIIAKVGVRTNRKVMVAPQTTVSLIADPVNGHLGHLRHGGQTYKLAGVACKQIGRRTLTVAEIEGKFSAAERQRIQQMLDKKDIWPRFKDPSTGETHVGTTGGQETPTLPPPGRSTKVGRPPLANKPPK